MATTTTQRRSGRSSHPTPEDRIARGKDARVQTPRESHAEFHPGRRDPVELLEQQAANRVPDLVPIRYGRMLASPFTFYRGAALVMAYDLSTTPVSGLTVQACGDAHLSNFGGFASPERELVFDLNDFDESLPGPFEWDVARLAASFAVTERVTGRKGEAVRRAVESYRSAMREFAEMGDLEVWYARMDAASIAARFSEATPKQRARFERTVAKGRAKDNIRAFSKLTETVDGEVRLVAVPPLIV